MFDALKLNVGGGLTVEELDVVRDDALELLAELGVRIDRADIVDYLASLPGVEASGDRVKLSRELVEQWIPTVREHNLEYAYNRPGNPWRLVMPYLPVNYRDPATGTVRLARADDARLCARLGDVLGMYGPEPLHVQEGPPALRQLLSMKITVENSREVGGWAPATDPLEVRFMIELGRAAGRKPPYGCMELGISPLRLNAELLGMLFDRRGGDDQLLGIAVGGGVVPMPGVTAPLSFPACLSQGLAEGLASYIVPQLIDPRLDGYCSFGGFLFNLRTMDTFHPYFPETFTYRVMVRQVLEHVLGRTMGYHLKLDDWTNPGKLYEMGFAGALDALLGARSIHVGAEMGDILSPLNIVIAADLVRHLNKTVEGLPLKHAPGLTRQLVEPGLDAGLYTDLDSTLNYRELYVDPKLLFRHDDHASLMAAARKEMDRLLTAHEFALPDEVQRDVDRVFADAGRALAS